MFNIDYFNQLFAEKYQDKEQAFKRFYELTGQQISFGGNFSQKLEDVFNESVVALDLAALHLKNQFYREVEDQSFVDQRDFCSFCHMRLEGKIEVVLFEKFDQTEDRLTAVLIAYNKWRDFEE